MADLRAIALEATGFGNVEVTDADKLLVGNIAPASGDLTIGGATATDGVIIDTGNDLSMSGDGVFNLAGTGNLNVTATGTHAISGGTLDVNVASDFSGTMTLSGGADLVGTTGSTITTFDAISTAVGGTIGGIVQESLLDKTANETITGQYTFQPPVGVNPKLIVKAAGGEPADTVIFQVQDNAGTNLFSVDTEGDVVIAGGETVAGTTVYTGDITLGDGGNTVQLGSAATPTVGDNVYINTTGTTDGNFSLTTENITIATNGDVATDGGLTLNDGGTISSTNNGDINITPNGTGEVLITGFAGCGSNCNSWVTNQDAVAGTAEYAGSVWLDGDGATNVEGWRLRNDGANQEFKLQTKQNPTLATNLAEVWTDIITSTPTGVSIPVNVDATAGLDVTGAALTVDASGIDSGGSIDLAGTLSFDAAGTIDTSGNNNLTLNSGTANVLVTAGTVDLQTNVTVLDVPATTGFSIGGTALTSTLWTATGVDVVFGGPASNADSYHTHSGTGSACGTTCNAWEVNDDAAAGTPEDTGIALPAGDGTIIQNWQMFTDSSATELVVRYKTNPTDPASFTEALYTTFLDFNSTGSTINASVNVNATAGLDVTGAALTVDASGIDSGGSIDLAGTLSFDAAGTIDTSGNNNLTLNSGTASILVTAGTVDLQTNVTTLDVPATTGFSIGGTALTSTLWTATGVDAILGGPASNADLYHTHASSAAADQIIISGLTTGISQYQAGYISANDTIAATNCSSATGTYSSATFAGVYDTTSGSIVNAGKVEVQFDSGLGTVTAGEPAILSWTTSGQFRNGPPAAGSGNFFTWAGIVLDSSTYTTNQRCIILIQPNRPTKR